MATAANQLPRTVGETLVNFAFDLAAGGHSYFMTPDERRQTLRGSIDHMAAAINQPYRVDVQKKRRN